MTFLLRFMKMGEFGLVEAVTRYLKASRNVFEDGFFFYIQDALLYNSLDRSQLTLVLMKYIQ